LIRGSIFICLFYFILKRNKHEYRFERLTKILFLLDGLKIFFVLKKFNFEKLFIDKTTFKDLFRVMFYNLKNLTLALAVIIFFTNGFDWTNAEMFTSTEQMTLLVNTHAQVTRYLKEFLASQYKQLNEAST
jgi:hypothetical protein